MPDQPQPDTSIGSGANAPARLGRVVREFLQTEAASGAVLLVATAVAVVWANSGWQDAYHRLVSHEVAVGFAPSLSLDLTHWVNDGLMTFFFLVVGVEIKRELVAGELRDRRAAALPMVAALGGMVVPALLYVALTVGSGHAHGWGIPMATDIAFALSVLALVGRRIPGSLRVFLLTLAIVDDVGAIVVIAVVYNNGIDVGWLLGGAAAVAAVALLRRAGVRTYVPFVGLGVALWLCLFESGVHATLAGVVMGLLTPAVARTGERAPLTERIEHALHPWSSFLIVPLFAFANAGITIDHRTFTTEGRVLPAVVVGLVVGKPLGISLFSWVATRTGVGRLPAGVRLGQLMALSALGGIGFTVSLFVADLAFEEAPTTLATAKLAILIASTLAAIIGSCALLATNRTRPTRLRHEREERAGSDGGGSVGG